MCQRESLLRSTSRRQGGITLAGCSHKLPWPWLSLSNAPKEATVNPFWNFPVSQRWQGHLTGVGCISVLISAIMLSHNLHVTKTTCCRDSNFLFEWAASKLSLNKDGATFISNGFSSIQDNQFGFVNTGYKMVHPSLALFSIPDMPFGTMYEQWPWTNSKRTNVPCGFGHNQNTRQLLFSPVRYFAAYDGSIKVEATSMRISTWDFQKVICRFPSFGN